MRPQRTITKDGCTKKVTEWADELHIDPKTLYKRLKSLAPGADEASVLTPPATKSACGRMGALRSPWRGSNL